MPQTADVLARLPPPVRDELQELIAGLPANIDRPSQSDMVGALIIAARESTERLPDALGTYFEIKNAWKARGPDRQL